MAQKRDSIAVGIEIDDRKLKTAVAEIESAFPKVIFNGNVKNVYVNYTQNNFNEQKPENALEKTKA